MAASIRHELLSESACAWALRYGFFAVAMNTQSAGGSGDSDAVAVGDIRGVRRCAVFESKVSRSDFKADINKRHRGLENNSGWHATSEHWYVTPAGLVSKDEVPEGWGLLEADENGRVSVTVRASVQELNAEDYAKQLQNCAKACSQKYLVRMNCSWTQRCGGINLDAEIWREACHAMR